MELRNNNILATLAYYDVLDWPLKAEEIGARLVNFKHLYSSTALKLYSYKEIQKELDQLVLEQILDCREKYYFLFDREYLVPLRLKREKIAKHKWQITKRAIWWLRFVPYTRAVFASGSLAMKNTDELSDLDVLIVVKHGRIWLSRFLILGVLALLGKRRKGTDRIAPDKICPNHFITDRSPSIPFKSIYNAQTYANLAPIYVQDASIIEKFKKANDWVLDYTANWHINSVVEVKPQQCLMFGSSTPNEAARARSVSLPRTGSTSKHWVEAVERVLDWLGIAGILEKWLGRYQSRRIACNPATHQAGGRVIFTDEQLEFHPHSLEASVISKYNKNLEKLGMPNLAVEQDSGLIN